MNQLVTPGADAPDIVLLPLFPGLILDDVVRNHRLVLRYAVLEDSAHLAESFAVSLCQLTVLGRPFGFRLLWLWQPDEIVAM